MLEAFADVLATADAAVIATIWAGRDPDTTITSAAALAAAIAERRGSAPAAAPRERGGDRRLAGRARPPGDVVLVMGGGRSYVIAERLVAALEAGRASRLVPMTEALRLQDGAGPARCWKRAWESCRRHGSVQSRCSPRPRLPPDPFEEPLRSARPPSRAHWSELAARSVHTEFDPERTWVEGPDGARGVARGQNLYNMHGSA